MKTRYALAFAASALAIGACSDGGGYGYASMGAADTYYDGYYGPFYDGYWGLNGAFYYSDGNRHRARFRRDDGHHFRRDHADGFNQVPGRIQGGRGLQGRGLHGGVPATNAPTAQNPRNRPNPT